MNEVACTPFAKDEVPRVSVTKRERARVVDELLMEKRVEVEVKSSEEVPRRKTPSTLERRRCLAFVPPSESVRPIYGVVEATFNDH